MFVKFTYRNNFSPYIVILPVLIGVFIAADDQTVIVTVLPQIMLDMRVTITELDSASWTVTGYLLGYLAAMPLIGRLSDVVGHRRLFIFAMIWFMVGSIGVAIIPELDLSIPDILYTGYKVTNFEFLIGMRVFQAIGAGALVPLAIAIAGDIFPPGRRALSFGLIGASADAGGVIGPLWGGFVPKYMDSFWSWLWSEVPFASIGFMDWIQHEQSWRWVFWINLPLSVVVIILVRLLISPSPRPDGKVDYFGGVLIALSLTTLTLGLSRIGSPDLIMLIFLILSSSLGFLFIRRQLTVEQPLIPISVFSTKIFTATNLTHCFIGASLIIGMVTVPLMANTLIGLTPIEGGLWLLRMTAAMPVGAIVGGLVLRFLGYRILISVGLLTVALGYALMSSWNVEISDPNLSLHLGVVGLGFGLLIAPITLAATEAVNEVDRGSAAGIVTATRIIGMTFGLAGLTAWGTSRFGGLVSHLQIPLPISGESAEELQRRVQSFNSSVNDAGVTIFNEFFIVAMILCLFALIPAMFIVDKKNATNINCQQINGK